MEISKFKFKTGLRKQVRGSKGFTLIEILIVVVLLGILAVAVLSAINPIEQIRKARDSGRKSDAAELLNAYERYFTTFQAYPSGVPAIGSVTAVTPGGVGLVSLINQNEVKQQFTRRSTVTSSELCVSQATGQLVSICFEPESTSGRSGGFGSLQNNLNTAAAACSGTYAGSCGGTCFVCVPQ